MIGKINNLLKKWNNLSLDEQTVCFIFLSYILAGIVIFIGHYVFKLF